MQSGGPASGTQCLPLVLFFLLLLLPHRADQIKCYTATMPPFIEPVKLVDCFGYDSCHEYAYGFTHSPQIMYLAGCGAKQFSSVATAVKRSKNCFITDACNDQLRQELMKNNRICLFAQASRSSPSHRVACMPEETQCFYEMSNSLVPFYNAGCGPCPSYTMSCVTCASNICNATDAAASDKGQKRKPLWRSDKNKLLAAKIDQVMEEENAALQAAGAASTNGGAVALWTALVVSWLMRWRCQ